ncbi:glutaminase [Microlunatus aurantiacus]|uniref:Glutaminase n=1 Tax=Microlunatus aurantiacus TaxID=446786 RepID=A0ABP7D9T1_9ACTN
MRSPIDDEIRQIFDQCSGIVEGEVATYIPELAAADPTAHGLCVMSVEGHSYAYGAVDVPFTVQSISKVFAYALALETHGFETVDELIDVEPSGEAFNELSLDARTHRPRNPMINAGAITASSLLPGDGPEQQVTALLDYLAGFVDHPLTVDDRVYASEASTGHRNRAIAYLLRSVDVLRTDPMAAVDVYFRQCSVQVTARDLALMAATLANGGVQPTTGKLLVSRAVLRRVLSVMAGCGMYDGAGHWLTEVGLPAKSGVSGGILAVLPSQFGVASFAPPLNEHGNSVRGVAAFRSLSEHYGSHLFEPRLGRLHTVRHRTTDVDDPGTVRYALQGDLDVAGTESVLWQLTSEPPSTRRVVVDLGATDRVSAHAGELLAEMSRRYLVDGRTLEVVDPQELLTGIPDVTRLT